MRHLSPEEKKATQAAYDLISSCLTWEDGAPRRLDKERLILLVSIRMHWSQNLEDRDQLMLAMLAYMLEYGPEMIPKMSTVEFFIGPDGGN